jgi:hypothetical protein
VAPEQCNIWIDPPEWQLHHQLLFTRAPTHLHWSLAPPSKVKRLSTSPNCRTSAGFTTGTLRSTYCERFWLSTTAGFKETPKKHIHYICERVAAPVPASRE